MTHPRSSATPTVAAILGTDALSEDILARLLEHEGYSIRLLQADPTGLMDELLDGVDLMLLAPDLSGSVRDVLPERREGKPEDGSDADPHALHGPYGKHRATKRAWWCLDLRA